MKVFVLSTGCRYEGGNVEAVYASQESGRAAALKLVKDHNDKINTWRAEEALSGECFWANPRFDMVEADRNYWHESSDFISLREMELLE